MNESSTRWRSDSEAKTEEIGGEIARRAQPDGTVLLRGDLGCGKTVLVRGMARVIGIAREEVQSPTYTLIHEHNGREGRLVHVDLYRLEPEDEDPEAWASLGLDELLEGPGLKAIEWPERLARIPRGASQVEIRNTGEGSREITWLANPPGISPPSSAFQE